MADIILKNGIIFNGVDQKPFNGSVIINDNKISKITDDDDIGMYITDDTRLYDCSGKLVSPGFNDGHTHIPYGAFLMDPDFGLDLGGESDKNVILEKMKSFAETHAEIEWIYGYNAGWGADNIPDRYEIDAVIKAYPVIIQHMDGHSMVVNSESIIKRGIDKNTSLGDGGRFGYDPDGDLNGRLYDDATFVFSKVLYNPSDDEFKRVYRNFMEYASSMGITSVGELYPTFVGRDDVYAIFKELEDEGDLTLRLGFTTRLLTYDKSKYQSICNKYNSDKLYCNGTKELFDGVITVHTALMLEPYSDDPSTCGTTANPVDELHDKILEACKDGIAVRLHCIGDGAVRKALDFLEEGERLYGYKNQRHGIEHIESCHPDDMARFRKLNICANMQPMHAVFDTEAEERFRGDRCRWCWPMRDLIDEGAVMSMGTDFPIVGINPFHSLYAAVTRKDPFGKMKESWQPHQSITIGEAMKAHTYGSAYSQNREDKVGSIKEGLLADIIVIDRNLFDADPEEIKDAKVELTIFDGEVIYDEM